MRRLDLSVAADADLFDILAYGTAVHGAAASDSYYDGLSAAFEFLCANPGAGPRVQIGSLKLRRWRYRRHIIFHKSDKEAVLVVRVLHVAMDAVRWLSD